MSSSVTGLRLRRAAVASVATMALLGLSACGGDDSGSKASDSSGTSSSSAASSDAADAAGSSKPAAGSEVSASDMAALFSAAFTKATSAHITLKSEGGQFPISADGDASYGDSPAAQMTMDLGSTGQAQVLLVDNVVYLKLGALGDKYVKFDLDDPSNPLGSTFTDQLDPAQLVKTLEGAITKATYVGNEDVSGEQLDHYTLTVDSKKMLANVASAAPSTGTSGLPDSLTYDMWFDDQGLFRQMKFDLGAQGTFTGTFSDWGKDVSVQAPPASEVTDMPGLPSAGASS